MTVDFDHCCGLLPGGSGEMELVLTERLDSIHRARFANIVDAIVRDEQRRRDYRSQSFLGKRADWPAKALSYSGQLAAYRDARRTPAIESTWIHFAAGGGLVQVEW